MTEEEKLVWRILCSACPHLTSFIGQEDEIVDHISIFEFTTNYKRYSKSFARFQVTAGEFFECLHKTNNKNEITTCSPHVFEE